MKKNLNSNQNSLKQKNQSYKPSWKSSLKSKSLALLALSNLPVAVTPFPQHNNLIVYEYKGLDESGLPILYKADFLKEPLLNGQALKVLEDFEKDVLNKKKADYNITGDIDDYIKELTDKQKNIARENNEFVATQETNQRTIRISETRIKNRGKKIDQQKLEIEELGKRPNITQEEFKKYKSPEQVAEIEKSVREKTVREYKDFINQNDTVAILAQAENQGVKFTQFDLDQAVNQTTTQLNQQLNQINNDLLNLKERDRFEIIRLKSENKNLQEQRDSRPDISFTEYQQLLVKNEDQQAEITKLQKRPNITRTDWEKDWSQRPEQEVYQETKESLEKAQKKVKIAEKFGLTDWENWENQTQSETLLNLLARPSLKKLEDKEQEISQLKVKLQNYESKPGKEAEQTSTPKAKTEKVAEGFDGEMLFAVIPGNSINYQVEYIKLFDWVKKQFVYYKDEVLTEHRIEKNKLKQRIMKESSQVEEKDERIKALQERIDYKNFLLDCRDEVINLLWNTAFSSNVEDGLNNLEQAIEAFEKLITRPNRFWKTWNWITKLWTGSGSSELKTKLAEQKKLIAKLQDELKNQKKNNSTLKISLPNLGLGGLLSLVGKKFYDKKLKPKVRVATRSVAGHDGHVCDCGVDHEELKSNHETQIVNNIITHLGLSTPHGSELGAVNAEIKSKYDLHAKLEQIFKNELGFDVQTTDLQSKVKLKTRGIKLNDIPKTLKDLIENDPSALQNEINILRNQIINKEQEVVKFIHDELKLGLVAGSITKTEVLNKIRYLIEKGGGSNADKQEVERLKKEVENLKNNPDAIVKEALIEEIKDNDQVRKIYGFHFTDKEQEKILVAPTAREVLGVTNQIVKERIEVLQSSRKNAYTLNWILGGLSITALIALIYLLVRRKNSNLLGGNEEKE